MSLQIFEKATELCLNYQERCWLQGPSVPPFRTSYFPNTKILSTNTYLLSEYSRSKIFWIFGVSGAQLSSRDLACHLMESHVMWYQVLNFIKRYVLALRIFALKNFWIFEVSGAQLYLDFWRATSSNFMFSWYKVLNFTK